MHHNLDILGRAVSDRTYASTYVREYVRSLTALPSIYTLRTRLVLGYGVSD